ncbi:TIGR02302 family protein [Roseovarius spongiae]|uniref:TIGR02302 family protein n=1 Tax=Roseovarius spongiae TaxID=2320272 RepID=A0A3A8AWY4_9RHOB|nr:TIGR02302 family protein [Roseovarius spongiae]RKF16277.1 TIGR02302 family protein [Roseovarius spongiae]
MAERTPLTRDIAARLRLPLTLTWAGLLAERLVRAFWPLWTLIAAVAAALMLGFHEWAMIELVFAVLAGAALGALVFTGLGLIRFRWPRRAEALARMDAALPGRPLAALADRQAIGAGDPASEALWHAHRARMVKAAARARAIEPDLRLARRDPFGLRYIALLGLVVALAFGSVWRVGSVQHIAGGGPAPTSGPAWEGWIEPPAHTGLPSLYLADLGNRFGVPEGSRVTLRLYGAPGALSVSETVSGRTEDVGVATDPEQDFDVTRNGTIAIDGPGGRKWSVTATPDARPSVALLAEGAKTTFDGRMSRPFRASDDYGVTGGTATFRLDLDRVERRYGLAAEPDPRAPLTLDLPMPITGDRAEFTETLVENLSQHPWAHLPVTLELQVEDARGQTGHSPPEQLTLPARRFFDPLAASVIEQRQALLWARSNAAEAAQILRAISHRPEDGLFPTSASYLRLRVILRRLEASIADGPITSEAQDEIAAALWDLGVMLEDGDIGDALERMRAAQERLSEAMKNGASDEEIAQLMQELRDATQDYLRQKFQQAERESGADQPDGGDQNRMQLTQQDLQDMMDRIQELIEQGRMAEAQQAMEEFQRMMENLRVTEGQRGEGEGQQAMEGLADTLREQQGLSDQAFRDLQEQFNPNAQSGQSQQNEGRSGGEGRGQSHEGQGGEGRPGQGGGGDESARQDGQGQAGALADRQQALRRELDRQRGALPGAGTEAGDAARDALDRAGRAMDGAEEALRDDDLAEAIDRQAEAMDALRDGMRSLGEALANRDPGEGQGQARGMDGGQQSDPLGRTPGQGDRAGTRDSLLQGEDVYRRARELLDEIRRRSGETERPEVERNYLERLLERF